MKTKHWLEFLPLAVMFVPVYFVSILPPAWRSPLIILAALLLLGLRFFGQGVLLRFNSLSLAWLATLPFVVLNWTLEYPDRLYLLFYSGCILFFLSYGDADLSWAFALAKLVAVMGAVYAAFTILQAAMPDFFTRRLVPLLNPNPTYDPLSAMRHGGYAGLTYQSAVNTTYLAMGIAATFSMFLSGTGRKWGMVSLIAVELLSMLLSGKRGPVAFAALAMLLTAYANSPQNRKLLNALKIVAGLYLLFLVLYHFVPATARFFERVLEYEGDDISNGRFDRYRVAWQLFEEHPVFGIGWAQFRYRFFKISDTHNVYLQLLCETGIVGTAVFLGAFLTTLNTTLRQLSRARRRGLRNERELLLFSLGIQFFFLLYAMTGNGLYDYYIFFFYVAAVLVMMAVSRRATLAKGAMP